MKPGALIRIHQISYPELQISGKELYADRSLLLPGLAVVKAGEEIHEYKCFLHDLGIGAELVLQVGGENLLQGVKAHPHYVDTIRTLVDAGAKIQFFNSSEQEDGFLKELSLGWEDTVSPPPSISQCVDNKIWLRDFAKEQGLNDLFPRHIFCKTKAEVQRAVSELSRSIPDFVVLKRPDLASGLGLVKLRTDSQAILRAQLDTYFSKYGENHSLIVEEGYEHIPLSLLWDIDEDDTRVLAVTRQLLDEHFAHQGNVLSSLLPAEVTEDDRQRMISMSEHLSTIFWSKDYRGLCGFDFMKTRDGKIFLLECNARVTAATYAYGVAEQIAAGRGNIKWTIHMQNLYPKNARNFAELQARLGELVFNGYYGILPFNVRCLSLEEPKCGLMCIASGEEEAADLYQIACDLTSS